MSRKNTTDKLQTVRLRQSQWLTLLRATHLLEKHAKLVLVGEYPNDPHGPACWVMELVAFNEVSKAVLDQITGKKA